MKTWDELRKEAETQSPAGMSWDEWNSMLLGLAHGALMIDEVAERAQKVGNTSIAATAELDRDAILQAFEILKNVEGMTIRKNTGAQ